MSQSSKSSHSEKYRCMLSYITSTDKASRLKLVRLPACRNCMSVSLTDGISNDSLASATRCGEVAGGCTRQMKESCSQRCRTTMGDECSVDVRPRIARHRATVRHTRQLVTLFERWSTSRRDVHHSRTIYTHSRVYYKWAVGLCRPTYTHIHTLCLRKTLQL